MRHISTKITMVSQNPAESGFNKFFMGISLYPVQLLQVFLRSKMGERYFERGAIPVHVVFLGLLPFLPYMFTNFFDVGRFHWEDFLPAFASWYVFIGLYIIFALKRVSELRRNDYLFDFSKYSLYDGQFLPQLRKLEIFGITNTLPNREIIYEPLVCFVVGVVLIICMQPIGYVIILAALWYSAYQSKAYKFGVWDTLEQIDKIIEGEEAHELYLSDEEESPRGIRMGNRPNDPTLRQNLLNLDDYKVELK